MQSDDNLIKNRRLLVLLFLLISNIVLLSALQMFGYDFVPYLKSPGFYIILINEILIVMIFINLKKKLMLILLIPLFTVILVAYVLWNAVTEYHYSLLKSPEQTQTVIVKYRVVTLGESSYFLHQNRSWESAIPNGTMKRSLFSVQ